MNHLFFIVYSNIGDYSKTEGPYESMRVAIENVSFRDHPEADDAYIIQTPCLKHFIRQPTDNVPNK